MRQNHYSYYTKIILDNVTPVHKRSVKIKDELIPYEASHTDGQGVYKRIQCRYNTKSKQAILIFLAYEAQEVIDAITSGSHRSFTPNFGVEQIDTNNSGMIMLNPNPPNKSYYSYQLSNYIPFSNDGYKVFDRMKRSLLEKDRLTMIKHPFIVHHLKSHVMVHLRYMMAALSTYTAKDIQELDINVTTPIHHRVINFKSKESAFDLTFTANIWLPEDLNIGNHVAYGFGQLAQGEKWDLRT